uniref:Uncharacterized protein n=1 Tax=Oryza brachyantha TaxID=4533 RepID=J3N860_ORYBR
MVLQQKQVVFNASLMRGQMDIPSQFIWPPDETPSSLPADDLDVPLIDVGAGVDRHEVVCLVGKACSTASSSWSTTASTPRCRMRRTAAWTPSSRCSWSTSSPAPARATATPAASRGSLRPSYRGRRCCRLGTRRWATAKKWRNTWWGSSGRSTGAAGGGVRALLWRDEPAVARADGGISTRRFIDVGINRVIYDRQILHQPGIITLVTSYTTYGVQPKIGDPTSTTFSNICKMTQGHPLTSAKTLPMASSDICKVSHL